MGNSKGRDNAKKRIKRRAKHERILLTNSQKKK